MRTREGKAGTKNTAAALAGGAAMATMLVGGPLVTGDFLPTLGSEKNTNEASSDSVSSNEGQGYALANAQVGAVASKDSAFSVAEPFHYRGHSANRSRAAKCLAAAAWYEAGDDAVGQRAVIQTVINRVNHKSFPNSFCDVVFEGSELRTGCQFTFTCDGSLQRRKPSAGAWKRALALSEQALSGFVDDRVGTATHYHATYVNPWWSGELEQITIVGQHIFYRWAGDRGGSQGKRNLGNEQDYDALVAMKLQKFGEAGKELARASDNALPSEAEAKSSPFPKQASSQSEDALFLPVQIGEASGRWAVAAMAACKSQQNCRVLGYSGEEEIALNKVRAASDRDRPVFMFVRDAGSNMSFALWDCQRVERPKKSECLPLGQPALANLMRIRS